MTQPDAVGTELRSPSVIDLAPDPETWDAFVARSNPGSYLQTSAWAEVKAPNGWLSLRLLGSGVSGDVDLEAERRPAAATGGPRDTDRDADGREPGAASDQLASDAAAEAPVPAVAPARHGAAEAEATGAPAATRGDSAAAVATSPTPAGALPPAPQAPTPDTVPGTFGAQLLLRRPRVFPWAFAYSPRGPVCDRWDAATIEAFTEGLRQSVASAPLRISHVRIEPEIELNGPWDRDGALRRALRRSGWRPGAPVQPTRTRQIDLHADEEALWGDLRKKWRQYVNKARKSGIRVVDADSSRLPEFYEIYQETAKRAGFIIRTYESYLTVWQAFEKLGMARLLFAETPDGVGQATLFLLRVGDKVIEPYGGMTAAGSDSRANYLLKWEAIRSSRERGAVSYDLWGLSTEGIEHFKTGFGGREIRYVGAWDLVLDPAGRLAFDTAQQMQDRVGRWRHGIRKKPQPGAEPADAGA